MKKHIVLGLVICLLAALILTLVFTLKSSKKDHRIVLYGNVDVRQVDIGFRVQGRVVTMPFQEGDFVEKGTLMAVLEEQPYLDQVEKAKASVEAFRVVLANSEVIFKRRQELIGDGGVSREDFDNALASRDTYFANLQEAEATLGVALKNYEDTQVICPNDGTILTRIREPGSVVQSGEPVYTLSLNDPVWIRAFVPEPLLSEIYFDMSAKVFTDTKGRVYNGHIGFISPVAEFTPKTVETAQLRTDLVYRLRIIADNPDRYLKQGMPVTVRLRKTKNDRR